MKKKGLLIIMIVLVSMILMACSNNNKIADNQETAFKIVDSENNIIETATLSINDKNIKVNGKNGLYKASLEVNKEYEITVSAGGYDDYTNKYKAQKRNTVKELPMERKILDFTGKVIDNNKPVEKANVVIKELNKTKETNNQGIFYFENIPANICEDGMYEIEVSKENYQTKKYKIHICEKKAEVIEINTASI